MLNGELYYYCLQAMKSTDVVLDVLCGKAGSVRMMDDSRTRDSVSLYGVLEFANITLKSFSHEISFIYGDFSLSCSYGDYGLL